MSSHPFALAFSRICAFIFSVRCFPTTSFTPFLTSVMNTGFSSVTPSGIRAACGALGAFLLEGCEIYASCEPCPMCLGAIYWAHLERIYFGNAAADASKVGFDDSFIYRQFTQPVGDRSIPMVRMMSEEAQV